MENSSSQNPAPDKHSAHNHEHPPSPERDTSQRGREEEVVNQQDQSQTTNSDHGDSTNKGSEGSGGITPGRGSKEDLNRGTSGASEDENQFRQGIDNEDIDIDTERDKNHPLSERKGRDTPLM